MIRLRMEHNRRLTGVDVEVCEGPLERARGLLLRGRPDSRTALLLEPCSAIHTMGMRHAIDVLFCDAEGCVLRVIHALRPWRIARQPQAACVWELCAGSAWRLGIRAGDRLRLL